MAMKIICGKTKVVKMSTNEILKNRRIQSGREIEIEMLQDTQECFQDIITDIDKELAVTPKNELTETLEYIQGILRESLPEVEADLHRLSDRNRRL